MAQPNPLSALETARCKMSNLRLGRAGCARHIGGMFEPLYALRWHRLRVQLRCQEDKKARQHPLAVFDAILRYTACESGPVSLQPSLFRPLLPIGDAMEKGRVYVLGLFFPCLHRQPVEEFAARLTHHLRSPKSTFKSVAEPDIEERSLARLAEESPELDACSSRIWLDFLTPLRFRPASPADRRTLTAASLVAGLRRRVEYLWPMKLHLPDNTDLRTDTSYWHYTRHVRASKSTRRREQGGQVRQNSHFLNGCVGRLLLTGTLQPWLPLLRLGQETNVAATCGDGQSCAFGMGAYNLLCRPLRSTLRTHALP